MRPEAISLRFGLTDIPGIVVGYARIVLRGFETPAGTYTKSRALAIDDGGARMTEHRRVGFVIHGQRSERCTFRCSPRGRGWMSLPLQRRQSIAEGRHA